MVFTYNLYRTLTEGDILFLFLWEGEISLGEGKDRNTMV